MSHISIRSMLNDVASEGRPPTHWERIGHNAWRIARDDVRYHISAVRYTHTNVVLLDTRSGLVTFDTGDWYTRTTRKWMEVTTGCRIDGRMQTIRTDHDEWAIELNGKVTKFVDGITFDMNLSRWFHPDDPYYRGVEWPSY